jgi:hypothetical protein
MFDLSFGAIKLDDENENGVGLGVGGTVELGSVVYLGASAAEMKFDDFDQSNKTLGIGVHVSPSDKTDLYAEFYGLNIEVSTEYGSYDESGRGLTLGLRHMATDKLEMNFGVDHTDIFEEIDMTPFIGAHYHFRDNVSLGFVFEKPDEATAYTMALRIYF